MTTLAKHFGTRLREARIGKGLTQSDLPSQRYLSEVERGEKNLTFTQADHLASLLNTDAVTLLGVPTEAPVPDARTQALEKRITELRRALREIRKEVRSVVVRRRIDNALKGTDERSRAG